MFFLLGAWPGKKSLGRHSGYNITMTYLSILVFFIPLFKFSKRYFAEHSGKFYELSQEIGKALERGEEPDINLENAQPFDMPNMAMAMGQTYQNVQTDADTQSAPVQDIKIIKGKMCMRCGFKTTDMSLTHCPDCENKLVYDD